MLTLKKQMKWLGVMLFLLLLAWCSGKYTISLDNSQIRRSPQLKVAMQQVSNASDHGETVYQEIGDNKNLDTLVIASESHQESSLSAYVQEAINQLKNTWLSLSNEKSQKLKIQWKTDFYSAILKTYDLVLDEWKLIVAQLFFEQDGKISILSYASTSSSHTKAFADQLKSLEFTF